MSELIRLIIVVEGPTEANFVRRILAPHLGRFGVVAAPSVVGKAKASDRGLSGSSVRGGYPYADWRRDLRNVLRSDPGRNLRVSTLCDLYGLPDDFPDRGHQPGDANSGWRCARLEQAMVRDIAGSSDDCGVWRLIPYIQSHEFEALVLSVSHCLVDLFDADDQRVGLVMLQAEIADIPPEDINDSPLTSLSHRLRRLIPGYRKAVDGPDAIELAGLQAVRSLCPRFDQWLSRLESLGNQPPP
jgi:hypothetical protein